MVKKERQTKISEFVKTVSLDENAKNILIHMKKILINKGISATYSDAVRALYERNIKLVKGGKI